MVRPRNGSEIHAIGQSEGFDETRLVDASSRGVASGLEYGSQFRGRVAGSKRSQRGRQSTGMTPEVFEDSQAILIEFDFLPTFDSAESTKGG